MARILILANNDIGLFKFRKELIKELVKKNEVYVSLPDGNFISKIIDLGCNFIETPISRRGTNPITDLKLFFKYKAILKKVKPDLVLSYTIKPNVYGGLICRINHIPYISNITGLGTAINNGGVVQKITLLLYAISQKKASCVFFQNESNRQFFINKNIVKQNTRLIPGSGVNLQQYKFEQYPKDDGTIRFLFIGRIMKAKGIEELLQAAKLVKENHPNVQFDLIGSCEEDYNEQLVELNNSGIIIYHGLQEDVQSFIRKSHATILPSYHEGISNVLLESASSGRPVLASRVPGCLETFEEDISGIGFEANNVDSLKKAIIKFINLPYERKKAMGIAGRKKMEKEFDRNIVIKAYIDEIQATLNKENSYELIREDC
jgi:glycosyltransferase involved in cell wall biosynthesis